jgi:hypothetical protein
MNERNLNEGQWEDSKLWILGVGQRRKMFWNRDIYIYIYIYIYAYKQIHTYTHTYTHTYIHTHVRQACKWGFCTHRYKAHKECTRFTKIWHPTQISRQQKETWTPSQNEAPQILGDTVQNSRQQKETWTASQNEAPQILGDTVRN